MAELGASWEWQVVQTRGRGGARPASKRVMENAARANRTKVSMP
jgi:hypothetical protein